MTILEKRKGEHVEIVLKRDASYGERTAGFEDIELVPHAMPELDFHDVDTATTLFGKKLSAPLIIDSMTGGYDEATRINRSLAAAAEKAGIAFGVGSQRAMIKNPQVTNTFQVREVAPTIPIFGNIGAVNLKEPGMIDKVEAAVKAIDADGLAIHLNPLQEAIQPEGDTNFEGCLAAIEGTCDRLDVPVIVKEVGVGITGESAKRLDKAGVSIINVSGAGGTSWSKIELYRGESKLERFADVGLQTAVVLIDTLKSTKKPIIVSGGVRSGVDAAKGIALGASYAAAAQPFLHAWKKGLLDGMLSTWKSELKVAMFISGAANLQQLRKSRPLVVGKTADYIRAMGERKRSR